MKTVTVEQFRAFKPCWLDSNEGRNRFQEVAAIRENWSAIDILNLENVSHEDKLWAVLRPELISDAVLHEFACLCAENALAHTKNPDPRSLASIAAKRAWLRGEITADDLDEARNAAWGAARNAAWGAALDAAWGAARNAAWGAAKNAAWGAALDAAMEWQSNVLRELLNAEDMEALPN